MSTQKLEAIARILNEVTNYEAAKIQLSRIKSKEDSRYVLEQLDPAQRRRIDNHFQLAVDDWVELPKGNGVITQIDGEKAQVLLFESNYTGHTDRNGQCYVIGLDWFLLVDLKLTNAKKHNDQYYEDYLAFKELPEEDKIIEEFPLLFNLAESDKDLADVSDAIRQMYANKQITKDTACAIKEAIPEEIQQRIDKIKRDRQSSPKE
jgi:hypothetical protein